MKFCEIKKKDILYETRMKKEQEKKIKTQQFLSKDSVREKTSSLKQKSAFSALNDDSDSDTETETKIIVAAPIIVKKKTYADAITHVSAPAPVPVSKPAPPVPAPVLKIKKYSNWADAESSDDEEN